MHSSLPFTLTSVDVRAKLWLELPLTVQLTVSSFCPTLTRINPINTETAPPIDEASKTLGCPRITSLQNANGIVKPKPTVATVADVKTTARAHK